MGNAIIKELYTYSNIELEEEEDLFDEIEEEEMEEMKEIEDLPDWAK